MTVIHIPKTPQYLNSRHVTYYVITCKSAFDWVYAEQWYVSFTFDVTDTHPDRVSEIHANKAVEAGYLSAGNVTPHSGIIVLMLSRLLPVSWRCHTVVSDHACT